MERKEYKVIDVITWGIKNPGAIASHQINLAIWNILIGLYVGKRKAHKR